MTSSADFGPEAAGEPGAGQRGFLWPPVGPEASRRGLRVPPSPDRVAAGRVLGTPPGRCSRWLAQIEEAWIGREPTIAERLTAAGWFPDDPWLVCPRCGGDVGQFEADADGCPGCRERRLGWGETLRVGAYEGPLRDGVLELKFRGRRSTGVRLGRWLGEVLASRCEARGVDPSRVVIVPVPPGFRRRVTRGIDHTRVLASGAAAVLGGRVVAALSRRDGPPQTAVAASARARNVAKAFRPRRGNRAWEMVRRAELVVVLDDVRTTGATLSAACRALRRGAGSEGRGLRVWAAVVAVTPDRRVADRAHEDGDRGA